ncbi:hypothetical protein OESDEN_19770 [Oesophagostomum dentatum]|uniref:SXP/RAL-2 family protein Ani s 5-like cation-binding domain-containing protein n=1 Tax=Oesophagostomum dentatum TaxID=61180 RepID=A0A0B1S5C2_OESDE|nr:hypothetical protein OESDEN_19770 [Oesophagostomum dentatum]
MKGFISLAVFVALLCQAQVQCRRYYGGGGRRGYGRGRWGGGRGFQIRGPCPSFLRNVTEEAWREYINISRNDTLTVTEINQAVMEWGDKHNVSMQILQYRNNMTLKRNQIRQNMTQIIGQLAAALQTFFSYMDKENLTPKEHFQQLKNLTRQHPELFNILYFAAYEVMAKSYGSFCGMYGECGYVPGFEAFGPGNSLACDCKMRRNGGRKGEWGSYGGGGYGYAGFDLSRKEEPWDYGENANELDDQYPGEYVDYTAL